VRIGMPKTNKKKRGGGQTGGKPRKGNKKKNHNNNQHKRQHKKKHQKKNKNNNYNRNNDRSFRRRTSTSDMFKEIAANARTAAENQLRMMRNGNFQGNLNSLYDQGGDEFRSQTRSMAQGQFNSWTW